jgi:hypothetical protein
LTYYIKVTESEFFNVWSGKSTLKDLHQKYSHVRMYASDSDKIEERYDLLAAIDLHNMPMALEQMYFKSELVKVSPFIQI